MPADSAPQGAGAPASSLTARACSAWAPRLPERFLPAAPRLYLRSLYLRSDRAGPALSLRPTPASLGAGAP